MLWLIAAAMLGTLAGLAWLSRGAAPEAASRLSASEEEAEAASFPPVSLIVPVSGAAPGLAANLTSLLSQDYPAFEIILVTASPDEAAVPVIRGCLSQARRARHVVAGPARGCGQKNHNLLAGLKAIPPTARILAFCDCGHEAPAQFLKHLVAPLTRGWQVASGYHAVLPRDGRLAAWGRAAAVLVLRLTKASPRLNQPWGGATAIRRETFRRLGVAQLWGQTVVDDVSLAARLRREGIPVAWAPRALLATPLAGETLKGFEAWLKRQWLYLKFHFPGTWLAAGLVVWLTAALALASLALLAAALWQKAASAGAGLALGYLAGLAGLGLKLRGRQPAEAPAGRWLASCVAALGLAAWVHARTWFARTLIWQGLGYRVGWGGRVIEGPEVERLSVPEARAGGCLKALPAASARGWRPAAPGPTAPPAPGE